MERQGFRLATAASTLALLWNAGSLAVLALSPNKPAGAAAIVAFSFSVLSLLPAVLLHISLGRRFKAIYFSGYAVSGIALILHVAELSNVGIASHQTALMLITVGFGALTLLSVLSLRGVWVPGGGNPRSRIVGSMSLFLFAISFVHFGPSHAEGAWTHELFLHHAGIPLALLVLLQDYRFLLLDVFLRFLANGVLAAAFTLGTLALQVQFDVWGWAAVNPFRQGLLLAATCMLLIGFAVLRNHFQRWLARAVLRRGDLQAALQAIRTLSLKSHEETRFVEQAAEELSRFVEASRTKVHNAELQPEASQLSSLVPVLVGDRSSVRLSAETKWAEVLVPLRFSTGEVRYVMMGSRRGGRPYLSEDLHDLGLLRAAIVEHVERLHRAEMQRLVAQAELRALRAQINPHFLFNALNALYGIIPRDLGAARRTVLNLSEVFRYFLQADRQMIALDDELRIVKAYLEIETLRLGDRLRTELDVEDETLAVEIPVLSIQPLVENAIRHGISTRADGGLVKLQARARDERLEIEVSDSGNAADNGSATAPGSGAGIALENIRRRLHLFYGQSAGLEVNYSPRGTHVRLWTPERRPAAAS